MAWNDLKASIAQVIRTNGNQEITGALLQLTLNSIVDQLGAGATLKGVATPATNPNTSDGIAFYIASELGTYANFGGLKVNSGEIAVFYSNGTEWTKMSIDLTQTIAESITDSATTLRQEIAESEGRSGAALSTAREEITQEIAAAEGRSGTALSTAIGAIVEFQNLKNINAIDGLLDFANGNKVESNYRSISEYIEIGQGVSFRCYTPANPVYASYCLYNKTGESFNFVSSHRGEVRDTEFDARIENGDGLYTHVRFQLKSRVSSADYVSFIYLDKIARHFTPSGIVSKRYYDEDGNVVVTSNNAGKSICIFGGSVSNLFDVYGGGDVIRNRLNCTLDDKGVHGAGFITNININDEVVSYSGVNIQRTVEENTTASSKKYDIYILWASTNDFWVSGISEKIGTFKDYTAADNFNAVKRLTQCGGLNYCIKKLQEFNPECKIVVIGSLKFFNTSEPRYNSSSDDNDGLFKRMVDGQEDCAKRFSLPFYSLWDASGINEYNSDVFMYHDAEDVWYGSPAHGNDGTHPNAKGYNLIAGKLVKFLENI